MSTQHTPGPWTMDGATIEAAGHASVVGIYQEHSGALYGESLANARLCAAAPDLLEACEALLDETTGYVSTATDCECGRFDEAKTCAHQRARAAIAKARGE